MAKSVFDIRHVQKVKTANEDWRRENIIQTIENRKNKRVGTVTYFGGDKVQTNWWELSLLNNFMHSVYHKYKIKEH